ncbi:YihY/virulence factor BrkB family protein [Aurantiacibacter poecillastricola]|uniref:YihY/virulence factor BrkB family protein n=1 Tax=Aurantiacibacter poecillastricola TaxID=3064385 RepID=UPI00273F7B57|nr:YihY/virulence factor BrkB family protein [Aurantiacibacter sp. 219JJ12-13]MDP5260455.1 YihY/virulence factor BrkB family protein [Aurantiacibacter sp. 219JJ12-13]
MAPPGITEEEPQPGPRRADVSPEARRQQALEEPGKLARWRGQLGIHDRSWEVIKRVAIGCFNDGLIHAGNLAYMSVLAIFPFFITAAAIFSAIGEEGERAATINAILTALPPVVGEVIGPVARNVVEARSGWLLWVGGLFGLWTVGSLVETIRDILRRAYGTHPTQAFWKYRLFSTGIIIAAVLMLMTSLLAQVMIGAAQEVIEAYFPELTEALGRLAWSRIVPAIALFGSIFLLFYALTPAKYRHKRYPKWPGAAFVTAWWISVTLALPPVLRSVFSYNLTYGSLAGVMIALFFFWLVGLGMVAGAELNAALAETPEEERERKGSAAQTDDMVAQQTEEG